MAAFRNLDQAYYETKQKAKNFQVWNWDFFFTWKGLAAASILENIGRILSFWDAASLQQASQGFWAKKKNLSLRLIKHESCNRVALIKLMVTTPDARFRDTNSNFGTANKNLLATNFVSMLSKAAGKSVVWISHSYCSEFIQRGKFFLKIVLKFNLRYF